jgi:hypothetical protein
VGPTGYVDLVFLLSRSHHRHRQQEREQPAAHCVLLRQAAVVGTIVFGTAEQFLPFLWTPTEHVVHRAGWGSEGIAMYVLPAETLLGPMILYFYHVTKDGTNWYQPVIGAGMTMLMYTGALSIGCWHLKSVPVIVLQHNAPARYSCSGERINNESTSIVESLGSSWRYCITMPTECFKHL